MCDEWCGDECFVSVCVVSERVAGGAGEAGKEVRELSSSVFCCKKGFGVLSTLDYSQKGRDLISSLRSTLFIAKRP